LDYKHALPAERVPEHLRGHEILALELRLLMRLKVGL
jgi:hypothetical protein